MSIRNPLRRRNRPRTQGHGSGIERGARSTHLKRTRNLQIESLEVRHLLAVGLDLKTSSDTGISNSDNITQSVGPQDIVYWVSPVIGGLPNTTPIVSAVQIYVDGNAVHSTHATCCQANAWGWSLTEGDHVIEAQATYLSKGLELPSQYWTSGPVYITVDNTAPSKPSQPELLPTSDSSGSATNSEGTTSIDSPLFRGTGEPNAIIRLFAKTLGTVGEGTVGSNGNWRVAAESLADGQYEITAVQEDLAGNFSVASDPFSLVIDTQPPPRPTVDLLSADDTGESATDNYTNKSSLRFRVRSEAGTTVNLYRDGNTPIDTFVSSGDDQRTLVLPAGEHPISADATDLADNNSAQSEELLVTVDQSAPTITTPDLQYFGDSGLSDTDNITNIMSPSFSGIITWSQPEAGVKVFLQSFTNSETFTIASTDVLLDDVASGAKEVAIASHPLVDGSYDQIFFKVQDLAGNFSLSIGDLPITIDTLPPNRPTVDLRDDDDTGISSTDNTTKLDVLRVRVTAEPDTFVEFMDGDTVIESRSVPNPLLVDSYFSSGDDVRILQLSEGSHQISVVTTDIAGNRTQSAQLLVVVDTTAPSVAIPDLQSFSDTGFYDDDDITNKTQPAFTGITERNATVRLRADGMLAAEGVAASDGRWEVTAAPLDEGVYEVSIEAEDLAGNVSGISETLKIEIDTLAPNTPLLDLVEADDSGRHNDDNITNVNQPLLSATTTDPNADIHMSPFYYTYRIYDRLENSAEVLLYESFDGNALSYLTRIYTTASELFGETNLPTLDDGIHHLKLEVEDRAGNISDDFLLDVLIDTDAPTGTAFLHTDSDTGIWGIADTMDDGITGDMTPTLVGSTEANALVRVDIDGIPAGTTVAVPLDGDDAFPPPAEFVGNYRLDTILNLSDGDHTVEVFFQDVAGNEGPADAVLDITIDTTGPRITNVTFDGTRSLFEPKPSDDGPDPVTNSILIHFDELPNAALAGEEGHYQLVGDANGNITIVAVNVDDDSNTVELVFGAALYDDRYTLSLSDSLSDSAGNSLDGESGALAPFEGNDAPSNTSPIFSTGDGVHGGDFHARFTIDTRPEIATYLGDGTWYVDLNGNGVFDPDNADPTHRDIVWKFGTTGDVPVVGDWNGDGYDEIGVLGKRGGKDFFFLDLDRNGAFDLTVDAAFEFTMQGSGNGEPISGDWDGDGSDEVAVLKGSSWFIDDTASVYSPAVTFVNPTRINTSMTGLPIAGDWDGDGDDNVGTFDKDNYFLDTDDDFRDSELIVTFPEFDFGGLKPQPVADDWDQDGDDDIGLFVRRETGNNSGSREAGEWFLDVNTDLSGSGTVEARFEPPPTGQPGVPLVNQDVFYNFGDEREPAALGGLRPVVGNFDPPLGLAATPEPGSVYTNASNNRDVNHDGDVTAIDALIVINGIARDADQKLPLPAKPEYYTDVNGDGYRTAVDALIVINALYEHDALFEGELSSTFVRPSDAALVQSGTVQSGTADQAANAAVYLAGTDPDRSSFEETESGDPPTSLRRGFPALSENEIRNGAHDFILANESEGWTELESAVDMFAADLVSHGRQLDSDVP